MKNEKGFTLIEMLIVMLIISVLLFITIPNITQHNSSINRKGCDAFVKMVEAQVQAYHIENNAYPTMQKLIDEGYLNSGANSCPDKSTTITIDSSNGKVSKVSAATSTP